MPYSWPTTWEAACFWDAVDYHPLRTSYSLNVGRGTPVCSEGKEASRKSQWCLPGELPPEREQALLDLLLDMQERHERQQARTTSVTGVFLDNPPEPNPKLRVPDTNTNKRITFHC